MKFLNVEILQSIINFFASIKDAMSLEYLLYIFVGLELLTVVVFILIIHNVYELKLLRAVDKINAYLYEVQYINEENLIEFNNKMKKVPRTLRYHWQQYMLYRENKPSSYMSIENCIDRPLKASAFAANIKVIKCLGFIYAILAFIFSCGWASGLTTLGPDYFIVVFAIPLVVLLLNYFFIIALNIKRSNNTSELYQTFHIFNRFIDKAISTMPDYVDFEVLFTRKEIKRGIPVLNEYIEKRQLQEQEEMKRARENAIQHELYNFEEAGEKGELVLERAMKETEIFVSLRNRLNGEIEQLEGEIESLKRNYENTTKDYRKKLQASKENIDRLREQQEATTNRIENNYIRKQQSDEIKKQQQIEKDQDDATLRYNQEINNLAAEIKKRKEELEETRIGVEKAMLSEYKTFSNKVFAEVKNNVNDKAKEEREALISSREEVAQELEEALNKIDVLEKQNKILVNKASERESYVKAQINREKLQLQEQLAKKQVELVEKDKQIEMISTDYVEKTEKLEKKKEAKDANVASEEPKEQVYDEFGGRYDKEGNYIYKNGTYYDKNGCFHDEDGNIYDKDGKLIQEQTKKQTKEAIIPIAIPIVEDIVEEPKVGEATPVVEVTVKDAETKPAGKRGRPRKEVAEVVVKSAGKRGRPRKVDVDENLKMIEKRLKEQNLLLKERQKDLEETVKKASPKTLKVSKKK